MKIAVLLSILIGIYSPAYTQHDFEMVAAGNGLYVAVTVDNLVQVHNMEISAFSRNLESVGYKEYMKEPGILSYIKGDFPNKFQTITKDTNLDVTAIAWYDGLDNFAMGDIITLELKAYYKNTYKGLASYVISIDGIKYKFKLSDGTSPIHEYMVGYPK